MTTPGLIIAAPASGTGKTTLTLALARAFTHRGVAVQCFKNGPDYIDPAFHTAASGRTSFNLDTWAMSAGALGQLVGKADDADLIMAEGAMGLFDGVATPGTCGNGATATLAALFGWPVILVLDPAGQAQTAAAVAHGLATFDPHVNIAGVILNRIASPRHEALVRDGMAKANIVVLGALPKMPDIKTPERHLGLVQAEELNALEHLIESAADAVARHVDLEAVRRIATARQGFATAAEHATTPPGQRIALARDAAFSFIYPHLIDAWRAAGAEIVPFSPLNDEAPDTSADVCWLPGGYPELHAGRLADAATFMSAMNAFAATRPVHGECGGYMALGQGLIDADGKRHQMLGLLGHETSFATRKLHLGYRLARLNTAIPGHAAGTRIAGHEFHYATLLSNPDSPLAAITDANGAAVAETGSCRGRVTGSFFHVIAAT